MRTPHFNHDFLSSPQRHRFNPHTARLRNDRQVGNERNSGSGGGGGSSASRSSSDMPRSKRSTSWPSSAAARRDTARDTPRIDLDLDVDVGGQRPRGSGPDDVDGGRHARGQGRQHRETQRSPGVAPHQLANELTEEKTLQASERLPDTRTPSDGSVAGTPERAGASEPQRRVGRVMAIVASAAVVIGLLISAVLFGELMLLAMGVLFVIPFLLLVSSPVWLASATKEAQDATLEQQRTRR